MLIFHCQSSVIAAPDDGERPKFMLIPDHTVRSYGCCCLKCLFTMVYGMEL